MPTLGVLLQRPPVSSYKRVLLLPGPPLNLPFSFQSVHPVAELFCKDRRYRPTSIGVATDQPLLVRGNPRLQVIRMPCVVGAISAFEDVYEEGHV